MNSKKQTEDLTPATPNNLACRFATKEAEQNTGEELN
jgi:hypothetical protein